MFGVDSIPLYTANKITFKKGIIECKRKSSESAGLALLWPVEGFGNILLPTARLPERKGAYNLNVELARAKLMQITLKREDWSLFDESNSFTDLVHQSKDLFIEALQNISDPGRASLLADESLEKALVFSEKLSARHAELFFAEKYRNKVLGRHSLGCGVEPELVDNEKYRKWLLEMFGFVTIPINWGQIESGQGEYDFSVMDKCVDNLAKKKLAICAGPLLCFSEEYLPEWLLKGSLEFEKIREIAYEFVSRIVTRYTGYVHAWRVISGMNAFNRFGFNFEQIIEMTRTACLAAKSADVKSRKLVEILLPWGEYYAHDRETVPSLVYTDMIIQSGISFDAFGLQLQFGKDQPGLHIRDMMQISAMLDWFLPVSKPLHITGVAVPDLCGQGDQDCQVAGMWHKKWDQKVQAEWIEQFYRIALSKPFINSITYSNFADSDNIKIKGSGLLTKELKPKKAFLILAKLQKLILDRHKKQ